MRWKFGTALSLLAYLRLSHSIRIPHDRPGHGDHSCSRSYDAGPGPGVDSYEIGGNGTTYWPYYIFRSAPSNPPVWEINATGKALAPGLVFTTPSDFTAGAVVKQPAPQIFTSEGQLVWSGPTANATNFKWQEFDGAPTLTYWSGVSSAGGNIGHGYGNVTFLNTSYDVQYVICPDLYLIIPGNVSEVCQADLHESYITERNTLLVSAYNSTPADLTAVNGSASGQVFDSLFFEIDPKSGGILFRWSALEHVPVTESHQPLHGAGNGTVPFDYFHINSVVNIGEYYLVNSRHTWTIYLLDRQGNIVWRFAGDTGGDFGTLPDGGTFRWQHHPRPHNVTDTGFDLSIFNNNNQALDNSSSHPTDVLVYRLPFQSNNATSPVLRRNLQNSPPLFADSQGSYQPDLANGNQFVNFGQLPLIKEYGPATDGSDVRWTGRVGPDNLVQLYRSFKQVWHGTPSTPPSLVVLSGSNGTSESKGYVSWNGATDVTGWNVYEGTSEQSLHLVGQVGFKGFETQFDVACWAEYVQIGAIVNGAEVRQSRVVPKS
ncbi:hypothetical protein LTR85_002965 [Meristemomyces frigidus]|nr:hypothetical protein LTR85_002965 [Meristemomyces frigidus]